MTDQVRFDAARAPHERDETTQGRGRRRMRKQIMTERDMAELEALLIGDLQHSKSPPIAAGHGNDEPAEPPLRRPARVRRRPLRLAPQPAENSNTPPRLEEFPHGPAPDSHPRDLDDGVYDWEREPVPPLAPRPRPANSEPMHFHLRDRQRRSVFTRAMSVAATIVSVVALLGVGALLVLLAVGGEGRQALFAVNPGADEEAFVAAESVNVSPPARQAEVPVIAGQAEFKQEGSRIPPQEYAARGGGIVRAVDAGEVSAPAPQPVETPPVSETVVASIAAPSEPPALAANDNAEPPRARHSEPATRTARVTSHVNMRAKPDNGAAVVAVVPQGKDVGIVECGQWCEIVYDDRQGFIHKRFVAGMKD